MPKAEHLIGIREDFSQRVHESLLSIRDNDLRRRDLVNGKNVAERLKCPRVIGLGFFGKETEGDRECVVVPRETGDMEEGHFVLIRLVGAVKEEDGVVGGKELDGSRMTEK